MKSDRFSAAIDKIYAQTGIIVADHRMDQVRQAMAALGGGSPEEGARRYLADDPDAERHVMAAVTVGETYFFRDAGHFERLAIFARERAAAGRPCRVLSAGASSGEEAWSAAAVLASTYVRETAGTEVVAWELDQYRVSTALRGRYSAWSARKGFAGYARFFRVQRDAVEVSPALRPYVRFEKINLITPPQGCRFDAIFFRNVSIYWSLETTAAVLNGLLAMLEPDGLFFPGPSDQVPLDRAEWTSDFFSGARVYRRHRDRQAPTAKAAAETLRPPRYATPAVSPRMSEPATVRHPERPTVDAILEKVRATADRGEYAAALALLGAIGNTHDPRVAMWQGILLLSLERPLEAVSAFQRWCYWDPKNHDCHRWLAVAYETAGRSEDALRERRVASEMEMSHEC